MHRALPASHDVENPGPCRPSAPFWSRLELQAFGVRWVAPEGSGLSSRGAGPSDHKAVSVGGNTSSWCRFSTTHRPSRRTAQRSTARDARSSTAGGTWLAELGFPAVPRFYPLSTKDGIPYHKIATPPCGRRARDDRAADVHALMVTVRRRASSARLALHSLAAPPSRRKTPAQLAEVARAAVELDGVRHMVMTTGTPATADRGALVLAAAAEAVRQAVDLPIQAQCEPPDDFAWVRATTGGWCGLAGPASPRQVTESVRARIMPGKAGNTRIRLHGGIRGRRGRLRGSGK